MRVRAVLVVATLTWLAFCGHAGAHTFLPDDFDLTRFVPPPPSAEVSAHELEALRLRERTRMPAEVARARADVDESIAAFGTLFGGAVTALSVPRTADLFARLTEDASAAFNRAKLAWRRPRPGALDPALHPCVPTPATWSYPSGHAVLGMLYALLLSDMLPEWRERLHARAREYAEGREVCGVHYPSDTQAGGMAAAAIAATLVASPAYVARAEAACAELRRLLGVPAAQAVPPAPSAPEAPAGEDFRVR